MNRHNLLILWFAAYLKGNRDAFEKLEKKLKEQDDKRRIRLGY